MFHKKHFFFISFVLLFCTKNLVAQCFTPIFFNSCRSSCKEDTSRFYEKYLPFTSWRQNELTGRIGTGVSFSNSFLRYNNNGVNIPTLNVNIVDGNGIIGKRFAVGGGMSMIIPLKTVLRDETTGFQDFSVKQNVGINLHISTGYYLAFFDRSALSIQGNIVFQANSINIARNIQSTNTANWENINNNRNVEYNDLLENMRNSSKDNVSMVKWSGMAQIGLAYDYLILKKCGLGVQVSGGYQTALGFMDSDWQLNQNRGCNGNGGNRNRNMNRMTRVGGVPISITQDNLYLKFGIFKYFNKKTTLVPKEGCK